MLPSRHGLGIQAVPGGGVCEQQPPSAGAGVGARRWGALPAAVPQRTAPPTRGRCACARTRCVARMPVQRPLAAPLAPLACACGLGGTARCGTTPYGHSTYRTRRASLVLPRCIHAVPASSTSPRAVHLAQNTAPRTVPPDPPTSTPIPPHRRPPPRPPATPSWARSSTPWARTA